MTFFNKFYILASVMNMQPPLIVTQIVSHMTVHAAKGKTLQQNRRNSYGLSLCSSGQITYTADGKQYLSTPAVAVLLPEGAAYSLHTDKAGLFPLINFHYQGQLPAQITVIPLADPAACIADFEQLGQLLRSENSQLEAFSVFYSLLGKLLTPKHANDRLSPAVIYITKQLSDPGLSNRQLAETLGISEVYLRRLFLAQFGTTPKQFILNKRIEKAKQLLLDTPMTVTAIAESCGFTSVYHFCRAFKEKTGITPTQYAKGNRSYKL